MCTKNFTYTKKFYGHEIAAVDLLKIYFLKNAKKTCKPNNRDLNRDWDIFLLIFIANWNFMCESMTCHVEVSGHISVLVNVINVFHDVNSVLHTVTSIYPKVEILLKVSNTFCSEYLALFTVTSIHIIRKSAKSRNRNRKFKTETDQKIEK